MYIFVYVRFFYTYSFISSTFFFAELASQFLINDVESYAYLNQSGCYTLSGVNDLTMFDNLRLAMNVLNITEENMSGIFSVLSAVLLLGNLAFCDLEVRQQL